MSTAWDEDIHPRAATGKFAEKSGSAPEEPLAGAFSHEEVALFLDTYRDEALLSLTGGEPDDNWHTSADLAGVTREQLGEDVYSFLTTNRALVNLALATSPTYTVEEVAKDFWETRNGVLDAFWDRGLPATTWHALRDSARSFGPFELHVGDDGKIYRTTSTEEDR